MHSGGYLLHGDSTSGHADHEDYLSQGPKEISRLRHTHRVLMALGVTVPWDFFIQMLKLRGLLCAMPGGRAQFSERREMAGEGV